MRRRIDIRSRTRYALAGIAALTMIVGLAVQITARTTNTITTASDIGLALTTLGTLSLAATLPVAARAYYHWAHDRGVTTHSRHLRLDATLARGDTADVLRLDKRAR
ncbi:hypothetical protein ACWD5R_11265 [Streptomyces sp. NPDC002514]|uniref:hypothetical protein n=1 Tax=unclassified Streptomyces TaxID=2593676 RepID=UPI003687593F